MNERNVLRFAAILTVLITLAVAGRVSANDIKSRMRDRLPDIVALKAEGIVGENNQGYLEFVTEQRKKVDVVTAENKDRQAVYNAIAKQQGTTAELVGSRRAQQIAANASPGDWLQDAQGKWYQK